MYFRDSSKNQPSQYNLANYPNRNNNHDYYNYYRNQSPIRYNPRNYQKPEPRPYQQYQKNSPFKYTNSKVLQQEYLQNRQLNRKNNNQIYQPYQNMYEKMAKFKSQEKFKNLARIDRAKITPEKTRNNNQVTVKPFYHNVSQSYRIQLRIPITKKKKSINSIITSPISTVLDSNKKISTTFNSKLKSTITQKKNATLNLIICSPWLKLQEDLTPMTIFKCFLENNSSKTIKVSKKLKLSKQQKIIKKYKGCLLALKKRLWFLISIRLLFIVVILINLVILTSNYNCLMAKSYKINIRPYAKQILEELASTFQLIIYTASHSIYANKVVDQILDPYKNLISLKLSRQHCKQTDLGYYIKDLCRFIQSAIINRRLQQIVIIDNAVYSFSFQLQNGIPILPYYSNKQDKQLFLLCDFLKSLEKVSDVRKILKTCFRFNQYNQQNAQVVFQKIFK